LKSELNQKIKSILLRTASAVLMLAFIIPMFSIYFLWMWGLDKYIWLFLYLFLFYHISIRLTDYFQKIDEKLPINVEKEKKIKLEKDENKAKDLLDKINEDYDNSISPEKKQALENLETFEKELDPENYENKKLTATQENEIVALCILKLSKGETLNEVIEKYGKETVISSCYNQSTNNAQYLADSFGMVRFFSEVEKDDTDLEKLYKKRTLEIVYNDLGKAFEMFIPILNYIKDDEVKKIAKDAFKIILQHENLSYEDIEKEFYENPVSLVMDPEKLEDFIENNKKWIKG